MFQNQLVSLSPRPSATGFLVCPWVSLCGSLASPEPNPFALIQAAYPQPRPPAGVGGTLDKHGSLVPPA